MLSLKGTRLFALSGALLLGAITPSLAAENLIVNGDFTPLSPGCQAAAITIPGWTVVSGNVDFEDETCNGGVPAPKGTIYYIDLTGSFAEDGVNDVGIISQTVATTVGQEYRLIFHFGGNPQWKAYTIYPNDSVLKALAVFINGSIAAVHSVDTDCGSATDAHWAKKEILFKATAASTTVTFQSLNGSEKPSDFGSLLGDVVLEAVKSEERVP
jgi:hypothetical protein